MIKLGTQNISALRLGGQEIKKAYLGNELVFQRQEAKTIAVTVTDSASVSSLLAAGTLTVGDKQVTGASTQITINQSTVDISFILTKAIKIARTMSVNGIDIGHVGQEGDSVSTTLPAQDGMTIAIAFTNYVAPAQTYTITATIDPEGGGTVTGSGEYQEGQPVTLKAIPADGYKFTGWQEGGQTVSTDNPYTFTATADRALISAFAEKAPSRLPEGYTEVEYVQSDGASWFDLGIKPSTTIEIEMIVETLEAGVSTSTKYFVISYLQIGSGTSTTRYYFDISWGANGAGGRMGTYSNNTSRTPAVAVNNNAPRKMSLNIFAKGKTFSEDGHSVSAGANNTFYSGMPNIKILGNTAKNGLKAKLYTFDRFDGSSLTLQNKLIPCINPSGAVGLYDLVSAKFYGNAGTGVLSAGPAV